MEPIRKLDYTPQVIDQGSIICHDVARATAFGSRFFCADKGTRSACGGSAELSALVLRRRIATQ